MIKTRHQAFRRSFAKAFTLIEVLMAVAIITPVLVTLFGIMAVGMDSSGKAVRHSVVGNVMENLHHRLKNVPLKEGVPVISPLFFDADGNFLSAESSDLVSKRIYRVDLDLKEWKEAPQATSGLYRVLADIHWVLDDQGNPLPNAPNANTKVTFAVTPLTGPDWTAIDPEYQPKIEF